MGYIPPEAMRRTSGEEVSSDVSKKWDVYSFAVLMCYTLSGTHPFAGMSEAQIIMMIAVDRERPTIPAHVDNDPENPVFKKMIQRLWQHDPLGRSGFPAIVEQLRDYVADPNLKRTVELAVEHSTSRQFVQTLPPLLAGTRRLYICCMIESDGFILCLIG